jgi:hypothetical protein
LGELQMLKNKLVEAFPDFDARNSHQLFGKLGVYHYNKKNLILGKERQVYNFLIKNSYNPYTVYRWSLLERVPDEIRFQVRNHYLSQKNASKLFFERRHETESSLYVEVRALGLRLIKEM